MEIVRFTGWRTVRFTDRVCTFQVQIHDLYGMKHC